MSKLPLRLNKPGPVLDYLVAMIKSPHASPETKEAARDAVKAVRRVFATEDGAILLDLLEKSTRDFFLDPLSDPRACDALNAQRFIALDLRRIASDEIEHVLDQAQPQRPGQSGRGTDRRSAD